MSNINIYTLPATHSAVAGSSSLREEIEAGLIGSSQPSIPGTREEDKQWSYSRSVPTVTLYDEEGLRLYDRITSEAHEYYLFPDELNLLKDHGAEIAKAMGFPTKLEAEEDEEKKRREHDYVPVKPWKPARWGDVDVGKWNMGVNGEEGLGGGVNRGYDVVELGAGALRKTAHLLTALSHAVPADDSTPPITYHPLDLSKPELERVLGEMDEAFGDRLKGKVKCIGLHGDYDAGIKFIQQGKLATLRQTASLGMENVPKLENPGFKGREDPSPALTAQSDGVTPGPVDLSPLPSAVTDETTSENSGTWSPIESDEIPEERVAEEVVAEDRKSTDRPLNLVFLGSSIGNFPREGAAPFLRSLPLRKGDTLLLGMDGRPNPGEEGKRKVEMAYNDPKGVTRAFEEHAWDIVRAELGLKEDPGMEFVGRYNDDMGRHEAYLKSLGEQTIHLAGQNKDVTLKKDELLHIEWSYKYSMSEALTLFHNADLRVIEAWKAPNSEYRLWLLERPDVRFKHIEAASPVSSSSGAMGPQEGAIDRMAGIKGVPSWNEWLGMWRLWDHITLEMIPKERLHQKPIDLRHICLFYLGHIPTFLDIHLTRMTNGSHTEPIKFKDIFERGIDPDVDDPTQIHDHSEVPQCEEDWPTLDEVLAFRDRVRARLRTIYDQLSSGELKFTRHIGRVLFMTYEHEGMHAETLLYMLLQSPHTRAPTAVARPDWKALARKWAADRQQNRVLSIAGEEVVMGHDDLEAEDAKYPYEEGWQDHIFGWDNEHPQISRTVKAFKVDALPISNADYLAFIQAKHHTLTVENTPASWLEVDGEWKVRTLYGPVGFDVAGDWPLMASKLELDEFAVSKGGRLPTEHELRLLWESEEGPRPAGLTGNFGVKHWHPVPPALSIQDTDGSTLHGHNGGVWEWTSSPFEGYEGYVPSKIYPGYSADFFDNKHYVVLGASYATIPSIATRKSFRNWYQANYRFSFIGGRVVYPA